MRYPEIYDFFLWKVLVFGAMKIKTQLSKQPIYLLITDENKCINSNNLGIWSIMVLFIINKSGQIDVYQHIVVTYLTKNEIHLL